ncbi:MAG: SDR family oxidoreductase [Silicimonas sp.]|nr:SDR family oxidoreductase [Silicimonas sp.]
MTKIALITGASRGLGSALAEALAPEHHIVAVARTVGGLEELDDRIRARGGSATLAPLDITDEGAMATLCRGIHDRWGKLDLWMHSAIHASALTPAPHLDPKDLAKSLEINVTATARLITFVAPLLEGADAPRAVFFDDPKGGEKFFAAYGTTKAAQIALARSWAAETANGKLDVRIVTPPALPTATRARFLPGENRDTLISLEDAARNILTELG